MGFGVTEMLSVVALAAIVGTSIMFTGSSNNSNTLYGGSKKRKTRKNRK